MFENRQHRTEIPGKHFKVYENSKVLKVIQRNNQNNFSKKNIFGRFTLPEFKTHYKATLI